MPRPTQVISPNLRANGENETQTSRALMREVAHAASAAGLSLSPAGIRVLVSRYVETAAPGQSVRSWVISYADPTGETAARNVDRERGHHGRA